MTRLDALDAALLALGAFLDAHGHEAACCATGCPTSCPNPPVAAPARPG